MHDKKQTLWKGLVILFALFFIASASRVVYLLWQSKQENDTFAKLAQMESVPAPVETDSAPDNAAETDEALAARQKAAAYAAKRAHCEELTKLNADFSGWLQIPDTKINYPVMYTPDDIQHYIRRDFYGKSSVSGTLFIGNNCTPDSQSIVIYGHNMKNGTMFGELENYEEKSYWEAHPVITFHTTQENREYEVFAAFRTRIFAENEPGFRYYEYVGDLTEEQFADFTNQTDRHKAYDTQIRLEPDDRILMLSTCSYHTQDGRFVVVAREKRDEENITND